jgi:hypothetical protein
MLGTELEAEMAEAKDTAATPSYLQTTSTTLPVQPNRVPNAVSGQAIAD